MAGCSRNDFFCITFLVFPYNITSRVTQKKKMLITLNAFEDE